MKTVIWVMVILIAAGFAIIYWQNSRAPSLGVDNGRLKPLGNRPNAVSTQADDVARRVKPWPFKETREATMAAIIRAVEAYGGAQIKTRDDHYLYVVFTTPLMKFHDDAEFHLDADEQVVHFRSSSRAGYSDRGLNRQRFERLTELYRDADV